MSKRTETYTAIGVNDTNRITDIATDAFIDSVTEKMRENFSKHGDTLQLDLKSNYYFSFLNICGIISLPELTPNSVPGGLVYPYNTSLLNLSLSELGWHKPFTEKILEVCSPVILEAERNNMIYIVEKDGQTINRIPFDLAKDTTVVGHAVNNTPDKLPVHVHVANKIKRYLERNLEDVYENSVINVTCNYDIEEDFITSIDVYVYFTQEVDSSEDVFGKNFIEDNKVGLDEDVLSKMKFRSKDKTEVNLHFTPVAKILSGIGSSGSSSYKQFYGPRFSGLDSAGKTMGQPNRGGAYLARYIVKNIIATNKFNEVTVYLDFGKSENGRPQIFTKAKMGSTDVEFEFPEHFNERLHEIFPTSPEEYSEAFLNGIQYHQLSAYNDFGENDIERPWENVDKKDAVDDIRI